MPKLVFLYVLNGGGYLKVGITRDLNRRLASMNGGALPFEVSLVGSALIHEDVATRAEMQVLAHLGRRARGEWVHADGITVGQIVETFAYCSSLLPPRYHYTFMPGSTAALSDGIRRLVSSARSEARAQEARDLFAVVARSPVEEAPDSHWQVLGKFARQARISGSTKIGPPTFRQWKKALQRKTIEDIAQRQDALRAAKV